MNNYINALINRVIGIFNKIKRTILPIPQSDVILNDIKNSGIIKDLWEEIHNGINIQKLDKRYGSKLGQEKNIYNLPLASKLSEQQTIELARAFFASLSPELYNKATEIIDNHSKKITFIFEQYGKQIDRNGNAREAEVSNLNEVYCPIRGDLRDLYGVIHEITHTFDLENGDTETRKIFGEIAPQCMERLLDVFLLNLSDSKLQKYGLDRNILFEDVRNRQISTFLARKDNIKSFDDNSKKDLRYILAQIYSFAFMKLNSDDRIDKLIEFMENIKNNDWENCSKSFGMDLRNKLKMKLTMKEIVQNIIITNNQQIAQETLQNLLAESIKGKNFVVKIGNQDIHIILESKIPFLLITPSHPQNEQTLVMESNNLETNDLQMLLEQAWRTGIQLNDISRGENPIIIPILPSLSPTDPYYQQLSFECFQNGERPDLDVIEAITKAKAILKNQYNIKVNDRIMLNGYSSSGVFAQRFALIHPELIDIACIGGASGSIPIPSVELDYPLGIKNYEELFGKKFNFEEYKKILFYYYVGCLEDEIKYRRDENGDLVPMHDMSYFARSVPTDVGVAQRKMLGQDMFDRAENIAKIYKKMGISFTHTVFPNIAHNGEEAKELSEKYPNAKGIETAKSQIIQSFLNKELYNKCLNEYTKE